MNVVSDVVAVLVSILVVVAMQLVDVVMLYGMLHVDHVSMLFVDVYRRVVKLLHDVATLVCVISLCPCRHSFYLIVKLMQCNNNSL
jgi:hypothetical protein